MKNIILYAYSKDSNFLDLFMKLLSKVEAKLSVCSDVSTLERLWARDLPNILLIDDFAQDESDPSVIELLEKFVPTEKRGASTVVVLASNSKESEFLIIDYLFKGADYIVEKPFTMVQLLARIIAMVRHQKYVNEYLQDYFMQTRQISTVDTMDNILSYTNEHITPIIQKMLDHVPTEHDSLETMQNYIANVQQGAMEVMAAINAIRSDVHELITRHSSDAYSQKHLDELFKKHLEILNLAYNTHLKEQ